MLDAAATSGIGTIMPAREAVTLGIRTGETTTFTSYSIAGARRKPATKEQAAQAGIVLTDRHLIWQVYQADLTAVSAPVPGIGSKITDSVSDVWIVLKVETRLFGNVYDLTCQIGR